MALSKRQQLQSALDLWTMYTRGAMRASPKQMRDLGAKITRLRKEAVPEMQAELARLEATNDNQ